jgi:hypothetical protein
MNSWFIRVNLLIIIFLQQKLLISNQINLTSVKLMKTQKTTSEIRVLLNNANLDFDSIVNNALNDYLPRIFQCCPFNEELCTANQCIDCAVSQNHTNKR